MFEGWGEFFILACPGLDPGAARAASSSASSACPRESGGHRARGRSASRPRDPGAGQRLLPDADALSLHDRAGDQRPRPRARCRGLGGCAGHRALVDCRRGLLRRDGRPRPHPPPPRFRPLVRPPPSREQARAELVPDLIREHPPRALVRGPPRLRLERVAGERERALRPRHRPRGADDPRDTECVGPRDIYCAPERSEDGVALGSRTTRPRFSSDDSPTAWPRFADVDSEGPFRSCGIGHSSR